MKKLGMHFVLAACLTCGHTLAATINIAATDLQVQIADFGGGNVQFDARGGVLATVDNPGPVGALLIIGSSAAPFGQSILDAYNGAVTESGAIVLDFGNLAFVGPQLLVPAAFFPGVPVPSTDAALVAITMPATLKFLFDFTDAQQIDLGNGSVLLSTFDLAAIEVVQPVPEPGTAGLLGCGLALALAGAQWRRSAR